MRNISGLFKQAGFKPGLKRTFPTSAPFVRGELLLGSSKACYEFQKIGATALVCIANDESVHCRYYLERPAQGVIVADASISTEPFNTLYLRAGTDRNTLQFGFAKSDALDARAAIITPNLSEWQYNVAIEGLSEAAYAKLNSVVAREKFGLPLTSHIKAV